MMRDQDGRLQFLRSDYDLEGADENWLETFPDSERSFEPVSLGFLQEAEIDSAQRILDFDPECLQALKDAARMVLGDPGLSRLAWHAIRSAFEIGKDTKGSAPFFPRPVRKMGMLGDLFPVIVLLHGLPGLAKDHAARGIPITVTKDTLGDLALWLRHFRASYGQWGLAEGGWLINHFKGRIFRLGRLQFKPGHFGGSVRVFRDRSASSIVVLAAPGQRFLPDGQCAGNGSLPHPGSWVAELAEGIGFIEGHPIGDAANTVPGKARFNGDFQTFLSEGTPILETHIPAEAKLDPEACRRSFIDALDFFPRYFPETRAAAFTCESWLFDPQFRKMIGPESNIVRFQDFYYLYPISPRPFTGFSRVFGVEKPDPTNAPRGSALQRAMLDLLAAGGSMREAGGFVPFAREAFDADGQGSGKTAGGWKSKVLAVRGSGPQIPPAAL